MRWDRQYAATQELSSYTKVGRQELGLALPSDVPFPHEKLNATAPGAHRTCGREGFQPI